MKIGDKVKVIAREWAGEIGVIDSTSSGADSRGWCLLYWVKLPSRNNKVMWFKANELEEVKN